MKFYVRPTATYNPEAGDTVPLIPGTSQTFWAFIKSTELMLLNKSAAGNPGSGVLGREQAYCTGDVSG
jgi:hypothetical protein